MKDNNNNGPDIEKFLNYLDKETADKIRQVSSRKKKSIIINIKDQNQKIKKKRIKQKNQFLVMRDLFLMGIIT
jgi:hypothetical protein